MRDIKFRAWNGERMKPVLTLGLNEGWVSTPKEHAPIEDFEIMEFTGLCDKDGNEIYEGDILHVPYNHLGNVLVKYEYGFFNISKYKWELCKIIGNIYENPELMK